MNSNLFGSEGFVSLDNSSNQILIEILRDTATQSLLLEVVLSLSVSISNWHCSESLPVFVSYC